MADVDFTPLPAGVPSISQIIRTALRAAAVAPTVYDALDVAGAALFFVAELTRAEVQHG